MTLDRKTLQEEFEKAYHSLYPGTQISSFIRDTPDLIPSPTLKDLQHICRNPNPEPPGMWYGMAWEAWKTYLNKEYPPE